VTIKTDFTEEQLFDLLEFWQPLLRLADWNIELEVLTMDDMNGTYGNATWQMPKREAAVRLADPKTFGRNTVVRDSEVTLVHELFHIVTAGICDKLDGDFTRQEGEVFIEQPTEATSKALVWLRRNGGYTFEWEKESS